MDVSKDRMSYIALLRLLIKLKTLLSDRNDNMLKELFSKTYIEIADLETLFELY